MNPRRRKSLCVLRLAALGLTAALAAAPAKAELLAAQVLQAGGVDIDVPNYAVPSFVDWNNDGLGDLIVGEGGFTEPGKVRVYLNGGTGKAPSYTSFTYVQSGGADLSVTPSGCLGAFPRAVYWDGDSRKDLIVGRGDGRIEVFLNAGTDNAPVFDGGTFLQVGQAGYKSPIDVGDRACAAIVDWNNDGRRDLVVGALDSGVRIYLNSGSDAAPDFLAESWAMDGGGFLSVPDGRSSPVVVDWDGDGKKDLLSGSTNGQIYFYRNVGPDAAPSFSGYTALQAGGATIDLPGSARSRPFVCDYNGDGMLDLLVGSDGPVRLFASPPHAGDASRDGRVDVGDLGILATNYGQNGTWDQGDFNADGVVDVGDLGILATQYGWGASGGGGGPAPLSVPEPATAALLLLAAPAVAGRNRRVRLFRPSW